MHTAVGVDGEEFEFEDGDSDDAYAAGDELVSWDGVEELAERYQAVDELVDDTERLEAAKACVSELVPSKGPRTLMVDKNLWLHNFPAEAAKRGIVMRTYPGWETRSRSTGGFDDILGICMHHTGSNTHPDNDMAYQWLNADTKPIGNFTLHRDGTIVLGAAGASNTQGRGGPYGCSKGQVPLDAGNRYMIAVEACNNGSGEPWPKAQIDAYRRLVGALCDVYNLQVSPDVLFHATWAPTRKNDPAGPTPSLPAWGGASGFRTWSLTGVRTSIVPDNDMSNLTIKDPVRIVDTRYGTPTNPFTGDIAAGTSKSIVPRTDTPQDALGVVLTLTGLGRGNGFFTLWSGVGPVPTASNLNLSPSAPNNNMVFVPLNGYRVFSVFAGAAANGLIIDQVGWYS